MSDRELLERAAKSAGIDLHVWGTKGQENFAAMNMQNHPRWNPLTDDGDAFRLAVKLNMFVDIQPGASGAQIVGVAFVSEENGNDKLAATRRAIVRAAAKLAGDAT